VARPINDDSHMTFQEIADELGLSRQGVKYVYDKAMRKLRRDPLLREYWIHTVVDAKAHSYLANATKET